MTPALADLAARLDLPILERSPDEGLVLLGTDAGLGLQLLGRRAPGPVPITFDDPALRYRRRAGHNELLGRAVGWRADRAPAVLDATAGFGRDAFILADLGCRVRLCERNRVMAALLAYALDEASGRDAWLRGVCQRLLLLGGDALNLDSERLAGSEVIYLDPMFPAERKALPTKEMQVLQALLADAQDVSAADDRALLAWSLDQSVARVVVKRPRRAPPLPGPEPTYVLKGRAVRFDVYAGRPLASSPTENSV